MSYIKRDKYTIPQYGELNRYLQATAAAPRTWGTTDIRYDAVVVAEEAPRGTMLTDEAGYGALRPMGYHGYDALGLAAGGPGGTYGDPTDSTGTNTTHEGQWGVAEGKTTTQAVQESGLTKTQIAAQVKIIRLRVKGYLDKCPAEFKDKLNAAVEARIGMFNISPTIGVEKILELIKKDADFYCIQLPAIIKSACPETRAILYRLIEQTSKTGLVERLKRAIIRNCIAEKVCPEAKGEAIRLALAAPLAQAESQIKTYAEQTCPKPKSKLPWVLAALGVAGAYFLV